ncbi:MAG: hypothetical protein ACWGOX_08970 [Desulforhopalus sp.]
MVIYHQPFRPTRVSFWLVPSSAAQRDLTPVIDTLADRFAAPRFMPHVTLLATNLAEDESPSQILHHATKGFGPCKLEVLGLDHGPDRFKSLFIRLNCEPIAPLLAALRKSCKQPGDYQFDGHLSLLYRQLSKKKRLSVIATLQPPQGPLCFDTVLAITPGAGQTSFAVVEEWQTAAEVSLSAGEV